MRPILFLVMLINIFVALSLGEPNTNIYSMYASFINMFAAGYMACLFMTGE